MRDGHRSLTYRIRLQARDRTLTDGEVLHFKGIPSFSPEQFRYVENADPLKSKQLAKGLDQLMDEDKELAVGLHWAFWRSLTEKIRGANEQLKLFFQDDAKRGGGRKRADGATEVQRGSDARRLGAAGNDVDQQQGDDPDLGGGRQRAGDVSVRSCRPAAVGG